MKKIPFRFMASILLFTGFLALASYAKVDLDGVSVRLIYHATVWIVLKDATPGVIAIDPWSQAPLSDLPKASLVLITDVHFDHWDAEAVRKTTVEKAIIIAPPAVAHDGENKLPGLTWRVLSNGESTSVGKLKITAVPMYNTSRDRLQYHPKGRGNGYLLDILGKRIFIAGDTECTMEMKTLKGVDLAFIPINLPYTMDAEEAAECLKTFKPRRVVPYHYAVGNADPKKFMQLLKNNSNIQVIFEDATP